MRLLKTGSIWLLGLISITGCKNEKADQHSLIKTEGSVEERVRPAQKGGTSAAYFTYTNHLETADTLISVSSSVAALAQVHESYQTEEGMMGMREINSLIVNSDETIAFKQGDFHVMLMQLKKQLQPGDTVLVELQFAQNGLVEKKLPVTQ